jgi:hypothetical protein
MPIGDIIGIAQTAIGLFNNEPSPEERRQKAGVWYQILGDWVRDVNQDSNQFADKWQDFLPFKQSGTKKSFMRDAVRGKSSDQIIDNFVRKINDQYSAAGMPPVTRFQVLSQMGYSGGVQSSAQSTPVSGGVNLTGTASGLPAGSVDEVQESKTFFYVMALIASAVLIFVFSFKKPKRRR